MIAIRLAHKSSFWARSATVSAGPTTPDQKTKRTTLRKSRLQLARQPLGKRRLFVFGLVHGLKIDFFRSGHEFVFSCLLFFLFGHIITLSFTGKSMLKTSCFVIFSTKFQFLVSSFSCLLLYCPLPLLSRKFCLVFQFVTKIPLDFRLTSSEFPLPKSCGNFFGQVTIFHHFKKL